MTTKLDQSSKEQSPRELWAEWRETEYSDPEIRATIRTAVDTRNEAYAQTCAQIARAMIAYNEMIDNRIERAQRTWGMK